jgi:hypothetical protein
LRRSYVGTFLQQITVQYFDGTGLTLVRDIECTLAQADLNAPRRALELVGRVLDEFLELLAAKPTLGYAPLVACVLLRAVRILDVDANTSFAKIIDQSPQRRIRIGPTTGKHGSAH